MRLIHNNSAVQVTSAAVSSFIPQVYAWLTSALLLTAVVAFLIGSNVEMLLFIARNSWIIMLVFLIEIGIVFFLSARINRISFPVALVLFMVYALLNGIFFGMVLSTVSTQAAMLAFGSTAGTFAVMSLYGMFTRSDLTRWGNIAIMGLFGIIIGSIINIFLGSQAVDFLITYVGIAVFLVLIAYDTQKLKNYAAAGEEQGSIGQYALLGALALYLDFINLFIMLLRVFSRD